MTVLLDVNVLVALAWPNHVHHAAAAAWFREERDNGWATCPVTESGFVRVSSNPRISGGDVLPAAAIEVLARLRQLGRHEFLVTRSRSSIPNTCPATACTATGR